MLILEAGEICPYRNECQHSATCSGSRKDRKYKFTCNFVDTYGNISDGVRLKDDQTGKMRVILE